MEESKPIFIYCYFHFLNEIVTLIEVRRTSKHLIKGCFFIVQLEQQANKKQYVCTLKAAVCRGLIFSTACNCQNPLDAKGQAQWHGKSLSSWTVQPIYGRNPRNCMTYQKENSYSLTLRTWEHEGKGAGSAVRAQQNCWQGNPAGLGRSKVWLETFLPAELSNIQ